MPISFLLVGLCSLLAGAGWFVWDYYVRKVPLKKFGSTERVQRVLSFEQPDYRDAVLKRGWMTSREWMLLNKKQIAQISAELKRRGFQ